MAFGTSQQDTGRVGEGRAEQCLALAVLLPLPCRPQGPGQNVWHALWTQHQQIWVQNTWDEPLSPEVHSLHPWHTPLGTGIQGGELTWFMHIH